MVVLRAAAQIAAWLAKFLSAEAFEQRARDRERRRLAAEIEDIALNRQYNDAREPEILARAAELDQLDSVATLNASQTAARCWPSQPALSSPAHGPVGLGYVNLGGRLNALKKAGVGK